MRPNIKNTDARTKKKIIDDQATLQITTIEEMPKATTSIRRETDREAKITPETIIIRDAEDHRDPLRITDMEVDMHRCVDVAAAWVVAEA